MEAVLVNSVERSLNQMLYRNAIFLGERLCAEFPSEENFQLLARCYLNNNQAYCAYHILKDKQRVESRYLFAMSCFEMDLLGEAEAALLPIEEHSAEIPNGAAIHHLLGLIYRYTDRRKHSVEHFRNALSIDPLLWAAYEELCLLGEAEEATSIFGEAAVPGVLKHFQCNSNGSSYLKTANEDQSSSSGFAAHVIRSFPPNASLYNTPSPVPAQLPDTAPPAPNRNVPGGEDSLKSLTRAPQRKIVHEELMKVPGTLFSDSRPRRSARLTARRNLNTTQETGGGTNCICMLPSKSNSRIRSSTVCKCQPDNVEEGKWLENPVAASSECRPISSSTSLLSDGKCSQCERAIVKPSSFITDSSTVISGILDVMSLLRLLGDGYKLLCTYRCQDALDVYQMLSLKQYNTAWVLSQVGKAYFHLVDYLKADYAFSHAHQISPYNLEGMDIYSTVLYHLKEDVKLCFLAQKLMSIDRLAPQSWCAIGNCYSLQKNHETAAKNFCRALQLNSRFAYAHTLCGHEYAALEDYENAEKCYQSALRLDVRHYISWYGLGMIYLRQEKFEFAEHHFQQAFKINPHSSVIMCYLGLALEALKRSEEALVMMDKAITTDKKNPLPMYHKASILVTLGNFNEALEVLEDLKELAPQESCIHALMGEIYKRCQMYDKAMLHFGTALDLKPSASDVAKLKVAIEKLIVPDEIEEDV
ncbi:hypothetical protein SLA2020_076610 [Shorea laevis]